MSRKNGLISKKYLKEIKENKEALATVREKMKEGKVTLVYGAKDEEHNNARGVNCLFK